MSSTTKPSPEAIRHAIRMRFSALAGADTINGAYAAHLRILAKVAARNESRGQS
jgi:hypothetical protein